MADIPVWSAENLNLSIGRQIIFDDASVAVMEGERLALVGRNGSGKSTLLKIIAGLEKPSSGDIHIRNNFRTAYMTQDVDFVTDKSIRGVLQEGLEYFEQLLDEYAHISQNSPRHAEIEHILNTCNAWNLENKLDTTLQKLDLNRHCDTPFHLLSGGEKRRVVLGRAIIGEPDLLLLDEPTNHLDVATIGYIEEYLKSFRGSCLLVTHDRFFLDRIADRIIELENGKFFSCAGSYADFLAAKAEARHAEDMEVSRREKFLRREIEWVRRSPKARLKRNMGRIRRFEELSAVQAPVRMGDTELVIPEPERLGNKVVDLIDVSLKFGERTMLDKFNFEFTAGHKVGIIGANGAGKTTLLKLITGELQPDAGQVKVAETVQFNYIDQRRLDLDEDKTVYDEVAGGVDVISLGREKISVRAFLKRFLFEDERINGKVKYLSGGEKARLLLAKVLKRGGNFLILDEPTNDLDLPTLRVLEEALASFNSTLIVVSHDRYFLNRVCNHIIAFEDLGSDAGCGVVSTPGDFDYYMSVRARHLDKLRAVLPQPKTKVEKTVAAVEEKTPEKKPEKGRKLSYREQQELLHMEENIAAAEAELEAIEARFSEPDFFVRHAKEMPAFEAELAAARTRVDALYARWAELEG